MSVSNQTFNFSFKIGKSENEALQVLKSIKESMSDIIYQSQVVDMSANDETVVYARRIYREAKKQIRKLEIA